MLETAITLAAISGVVKGLNKIKKYREDKKKVDRAEQEVSERFPDSEKRNVVRLTLFLSDEEMDFLESHFGEFLEAKVLTDEEAVAVLRKKEGKK